MQISIRENVDSGLYANVGEGNVEMVDSEYMNVEAMQVWPMLLT